MAISQPGYSSAGFATRGNYDFVSAMNIHMPEVDNAITKRFGSQLISEFMMMIGNSKPVSSLEYLHYEENRIYPKIKATNGGAGSAGAQVTFTLDASATDAIAQASPYVGSTSEDVVQAREGDLLLIKPASGAINASTYVRAIVESVNAGAGTFVARPLSATDAIPNVAVASEIMIYGNAFAEGSNQPGSRISKVSEYKNNVQTIKETFEVTGTENAVITWFDEDKTYTIKGEADAYKRFLASREYSLMLGEKITNTALNNIQTTEGLIPFMLSQGNVSTYSNVTGFDLNEMQAIVKVLDKQKGAKKNMFAAGIDLSLAIDDALNNYRDNGAIQFGSYSFDQNASANFEFDKFKIGSYSFMKSTFDGFNDLQATGADGYNFPQEGMIIPMDNQIDPQTREAVPSVRIRYQVDPQTGARRRRAEVLDMFKQTENGADKFQVRYMDTVGFEGFAGNRFVYVQKG